MHFVTTQLRPFLKPNLFYALATWKLTVRVRVSQLTPIIWSIFANVIFHKCQRFLSAVVSNCQMENRMPWVWGTRFRIASRDNKLLTCCKRLFVLIPPFLFFNARVQQEMRLDQTRSAKASTNVIRGREKLLDYVCRRAWVSNIECQTLPGLENYKIEQHQIKMNRWPLALCGASIKSSSSWSLHRYL